MIAMIVEMLAGEQKQTGQDNIMPIYKRLDELLYNPAQKGRCVTDRTVIDSSHTYTMVWDSLAQHYIVHDFNTQTGEQTIMSLPSDESSSLPRYDGSSSQLNTILEKHYSGNDAYIPPSELREAA